MKTQEHNDYHKQADDFLTNTGTTFRAEFKKHAPYFDEKKARDIYTITLKRGNRSYTFTFGQSLHNSLPDVLCRKMFKKDRPRTFWESAQLASEQRRAKHWREKLADQLVPTPYDVLSCLTKYDPGTFEDFCSNYGYDTDSRKAEKTYNAVRDEWLNVCALFSDSELEQLAEIN